MRPLFHAMLAIAKRYQDQKTVIRLRNEWVEVDPSDWPADMDVDVMVGLGSGTKQDRLVGLLAIMQKQAELKAQGSPLVTAQNEAEALKTFVELQGYKNTGRFFTEMSPEELQAAQQQAQEQQKQAAIEAATFAAQAEAAKAAAVQQEKTKGEIEKAKIDASLAQGKMIGDWRLKKEEQDKDLRLGQDKAAKDLTLGREKLKSDAGLTMEEALMRLTVQQHQIAAKERVDMAHLAFEREAKLLELEIEKQLEIMKMRNQSAGGQGNVREVVRT